MNAYERQKNKAVFIDRDGVINYELSDYVKNLREFKFLDGVFEAIKIFNENDFKVIIITNQSAINRKLTTFSNVDAIHHYLIEHAKKNGCVIDAIYYCPHIPEENCDCRKPKIGLFLKASLEHDIDFSKSWMIGDKDIDVEAGSRAGCKTLKVKTNGKLIDGISQISIFKK